MSVVELQVLVHFLCKEMFNYSLCSPNYVTYRVLIKHCCNVGFLDDAHCLFKEMKQTYWPMHISCYQKVIEGFSRDFLTTLDLMDVVGEKNNVPIAAVYRILIDSFCKAGMPYSSALAETYSLLIKSLCLSSRVDQAFQLFDDLGRQGVSLNKLVFFSPVMELIKLNQWEEALQFSYGACHLVCYLLLTCYKTLTIRYVTVAPTEYIAIHPVIRRSQRSCKNAGAALMT